VAAEAPEPAKAWWKEASTEEAASRGAAGWLPELVTTLEVPADALQPDGVGAASLAGAPMTAEPQSVSWATEPSEWPEALSATTLK
jgi:hypothetical protein